MKREHLEILWGQIGSSCLGPPFRPVPNRTIELLTKKKIIKDIECLMR
jgi:hypothetical protein